MSFNSSDPMKTNPAMSALRHHVSGAIDRGEAQAITEIPAPTSPAHTPGPWDVEPKGSRHFVDGADGLTVAYLDRAGVRERSEIEANARLIASAPELLEALAGCADALREAGKDFAQANKLAVRPNLYELHERSARAAIAKARG